MTPIPPNYRQSSKWIGNLDAASAIAVGLGVVIAVSVLTGHAPWWEKVPEILVSLAVGLVLGLGRWPMEHGDRPLRWALRAYWYFMRPKRGSAFSD